MDGLYFSLHQSSAHPWSPEWRGRHAFEERDSPRKVEVAPRVGSGDFDLLWESGGGSVCLKRECALPAVLLPIPLPAGRGRSDIALASSQVVCVSSNQDTATGVIQDQGVGSFGDTHRPKLANPALVPRPDRAAGGTALADPHQEGPAISGERLGLAPDPRVVEPSCMAALGISEELSALHSRVLNMLVEARAPATRRLYALKWGVFVKCCGDVHIDPATCSVLDVLHFLQHRLDSWSLPSTLKVYCRFSTAWYDSARRGSLRHGNARFGPVCVSTAV